MSLAQHIGNTAGFDYEAAPLDPNDIPVDVPDELVEELLLDSSDKPPQWKQMTFNAFAAPDDMVCLAPVGSHHVDDEVKPVIPTEPRMAAYRVGDGKRLIQVITAIIACWLASGIIFGFAALKPVLIAEGVFSELCMPSTEEGTSLAFPCPEQDLRLNFFFVVGSITTNVSSLFAGAALDRFGRRTCWLLSSTFLFVGSLLLAFSFAIDEFDGYTLGNFFLGIGGTFLFVPSYQLANAFPRHSGLIVALITGAFDASAAVFLFYRMSYDATDGAFSLEKFFFMYCVVPVFILVAEYGWMNPRGYHTIPELEEKICEALDSATDIHTSDEEIDDDNELHRVRSARAERRVQKLDRLEGLMGDEEAREGRVKAEEERQEVSVVWGVLHGLSAHRQMMTPWFVFILLLTVVQMLRFNYFIATVYSQYRYMLASEIRAEAINRFFDVALPLGGLASTPFIGILLNHMSVPAVFALITGFVAFMSVLNCLPYIWAGYTTVIVFVIFRPLYYSAISDYATKVFGFRTFGRIYGTLVCISGLISFLQSALDALTHGPLESNPLLINVGLGTFGTVLAALLTVFMVLKARLFSEGKIRMAADRERDRKSVV